MTTVSSPSTPYAAGFERLLAAFRERLDAALTAHLEERQRRVASYAPEAEELVAALRSLAEADGKRLRPALVYHGYLACGGEEEERAIGLAVAVELFHSYLLVHDDIMDHAPVRRGLPAAHVRFRELHRERRWHGDGAAYGESVAILVGDLAHAYALEALEGALHGSERAPDVRGAFFAMSEEVIAGQHLEMRVAVRRQATEDELLDVLRLKSGAYSVEHPLGLGALLAGADDDLRRALGGFGRAVGEAFQLQDDVLGLFGHAEVVGKPVGGDLAEGKLTPLIRYALEATAGEDRRAVEGALGRQGIRIEEVERVREVVRASGALQRVERMIADRLASARRRVADLELEPRGRAFLDGLITYLAERER